MAHKAVFAFVVGSGRSGTTLLRSMLHSHPVLAVARESSFIPRTAARRRRYQTDHGFDHEAFAADVCRLKTAREALGIDRRTLVALLEADPPADYADAVRSVYRWFAEHHDKQYGAEKTPDYVTHVELLAELFPEARFVHLVRDGRDVAAAYRDANFGPSQVTETAFHWRRQVTAGRRAGAKLGPSRYLEVRYEDLLDDPQSALSATCDFLGLEFDEAMLRYFEKPVADLGSDRAHHTHVGLPPTRGLRDWRRELTPAEVASFEAVAGTLLTDLGYERATKRPGSRARVNAGTTWLRWRFKALRARAHAPIRWMRWRRGQPARSADAPVRG